MKKYFQLIALYGVLTVSTAFAQYGAGNSRSPALPPNRPICGFAYGPLYCDSNPVTQPVYNTGDTVRAPVSQTPDLEAQPWSALANGLAIYTSNSENLNCDIPYKCSQFYKTATGESFEAASAAALLACEEWGHRGEIFVKNCRIVQATRATTPARMNETFEVEIIQDNSWGGLESALWDKAYDACRNLKGRVVTLTEPRYSSTLGATRARASYVCQ